MLVLAAAVVLLDVGFSPELLHTTVGGVNVTFYFICGAALVFFLVTLYFRHMERAQLVGYHSYGLDFLQTVHKYRFLIEQLALRDFKIKYKRSVLGVFWSFLNPLLMMLVQYVVFSHIFNVRAADVQHYAIYLLCGIIIWNGFNDCSAQALRSIIGNAPLITKVYVPKYIYPVSKVVSASINIVLSMIPLLLVTTVYGLFSTPHLYLSHAVALLPFGLLLLLIFVIGLGFLLSALMVFFHDVEYLWGIFSMIWMYATPIIYSLSMFEERAGWIVTAMQFNPMYHYIQFFRTIILDGKAPALSEFGICLGFGILAVAVGLFVFRKTQDKFILYL